MLGLRKLLRKYVDRHGFDLKAIRDEYCQCGGNDLETFRDIYQEELIGG